MRPLNLLLGLVIAAALAMAATPPARSGARPKNVVLIVGDDHGRQLGCYGDPIAQTPNLDRLAAEGTRFDNAFCTTPSCSPSRASLLTGLYSHRNGTYGLQHATHKQESHRNLKSMSGLLKAEGYRTCSIGKLHVGPPEVFPFDTFANEGIEQRNTLRMAENAEKWIREGGDKPFFLFFCPVDPHRAQKGFGNDREYTGLRTEKVDPAKVPVPRYLPDRPEVREDLAEYYQSVARMDQGVGRLMEALKATNHLDDTLVIYLSDNGIPFPNAKTNLYDPGIRLPLIVRRPGGKARGVVSQAMVSWTDILPTVLDWANVKPPAYPLHGRSFLKTLDEERPDGWDEVYASHQFHEITMYYPMRMLRTRTHKLILNIAHRLEFPAAQDLFDSPTWQGMLQRKDPMCGPRTTQAYLHRPQYELYDLEKDPDELENLAGLRTCATTLSKMQSQLREWQEKTGDPWAIKYRHE